MQILVLLLLAIVPPAVLLLITYHLDKIEKEPLGLLIGLFFMGVLSTIPAIVCELLGETILKVLVLNKWIYYILYAFCVVAASEEGFKFLLMKLLSWKNKEFNYRFDGIVYAVSTSLGFATAENIMYVLKNGVSNGIVRAITAIPLHASCGVLMGIYYGFARGCEYANNRKGSVKNQWKALGIAVCIHGIYDFCLFTQSALLILAWVIFTVATFIVVLRKVISYHKTDHPIVQPNGNFIGQQGMWFPVRNSVQSGNPGFPVPNGSFSMNAGMAGPGMQPTMNAGMAGPGMQPTMNAGMAGPGMQPTMNAGMAGSGMQPTMNAGMAGPGMQPTMNAGMAGSGMQPTMSAGMAGFGIQNDQLQHSESQQFQDGYQGVAVAGKMEDTVKNVITQNNSVNRAEFEERVPVLKDDRDGLIDNEGERMEYSSGYGF